MTPKEKAKKLVDKFCTVTAPYEDISARQMAILCAIMAADEVLYVLGDPTYFHETRNFWIKVKEEINKL